MIGNTTENICPAEATIVRIQSEGEVLELDYNGAMCQHPGSLWWGTAVGYRTMQVAAKALSKNGLWSRDDLYVVTGHPGPGVKDAIDYVAKVVDKDRYHAVVADGCGMQCNSQMKFEWWVSDGKQTAHINLRPDFVPIDFYELSDRLDTPKTTKEDIKLFRIFKVNLSTRIWNAPLEESFTVEVLDSPIEPGELPDAVDEHYFDDVVTNGA